MQDSRNPNRLIKEKSPYLLQHAYNPVDWYPWGEEAFSRARSEQKPIFLSIGYSTCHWCHVMERESFENDAIAAILNKHFICIKVDREERPDVDKVYMAALQGMGQGGGWPMSMFLTPDLKPFFGGTYFPPETRHGRAGFPDLLLRVQELWEKEQNKLVESADAITNVLREIPVSVGRSETLDAHVLDLCYMHFEQTYDAHFGGFGGAPKFPRPSVFDFFFKYYHRTGDKEALEMAASTLLKMANGGIRDHIGGGFHRYSVDAGWRVPHFEKMLYDQAQLIRAHVSALRLTGQPGHTVIIRDTLEYVLRDMTDANGGFYSAEDADSDRADEPGEQGEGAFYVWTSKEVVNLLGEGDGKLFCFVYGIEPAGNVQSDPHREFTGRNILYLAHTAGEAATTFGIREDEVNRCLEGCRRTLFETRSKRPRPHLDDKILTSWNGLMIGACAQAFQVLADERYRDAGERAANFILSSMYDPQSGTLLRRFRDGHAGLEAHLDDYAFLVEGLLDLYESTFDLRWMEVAIKLTRTQIRLFWDEKNGGFFDTSGNDSSILVRMKEMYDGAEPAGNSVAAMNLLRLSAMTNNGDWKWKAEQTFRAFSEVMNKQPNVMPAMVSALADSLTKQKQIVIAGPPESPRTRELLSEVWRRYIPAKILLGVHDEESQKAVAEYIPVVATMGITHGKSTAYVCEDFVCRLPTSDPEELAHLLDQPLYHST